MKIWKFHRWVKDPATGTWREPSYVSEGVFVKVWEISFSEAEMNAKLDGDMAEVVDPGKPWYVQLWRSFFPLKITECLNPFRIVRAGRRPPGGIRHGLSCQSPVQGLAEPYRADLRGSRACNPVG